MDLIPVDGRGEAVEAIDFDHVLGLFTHAHTSSLHARQLAVLRRVIGARAHGFLLRELPAVAALLPLVAARAGAADGGVSFEKPHLLLVRLCALPPARERANEEFLANGLEALQSIMAALVDTLCDDALPQAQRAAAVSLREAALGKDRLRSEAEATATVRILGAGDVRVADLRPAPRELMAGVLLRAGVVPGVVGELTRQVTAALSGVPLPGSAAARGADEQAAAARAFAIELSATSAAAEADELAQFNPEELAATYASPASPLGGGDDDLDFDDRLGEDSAEPVADAADSAAVSRRPLLMALMHLLVQLSASAPAAAAMIKAGAATTVVSLLRAARGIRDPLIGVAVEVLWNLLEHSAAAVTDSAPPASRSALIERWRKTNALWTLATTEAVTALRELLGDLLLEGYRVQDKELRNEVLILASLVARHPDSNLPFRESGMLPLLVAYATAAELGLRGGQVTEDAGGQVLLADAHNFATVSQPDLELKRLLWALLSDLAKSDSENLALIAGSSLMEALLMYLDVDVGPDAAADNQDDVGFAPEPSSGGDGTAAGFGDTGGSLPQPPSGADVIKRLPRTQLRVLQRQALSVLLNLAPRAPERFQALGGHILTLRFLDRMSQDESTDSRPLVQAALMLLISVVGLPGLQEELAELDAVRIMLARFCDRSAPVSLRADAVSILARLCAGGHAANQDLFRRADGISALIDELETYSAGRQPASRIKPGEKSGVAGVGGSATEKVSPLIVGVVDCMWHAVVGSKRSEARLLQSHGTDALLSMFEVAPKLMRSQIAGVLADLCANPRIVPYMKAWRSDRTMRSATELLMAAFEDEEARLLVHRPNGVITNVEAPLREQQPPPEDGSLGETGGGATSSKVVERLAAAISESSQAHRTEQSIRRAVERHDLRAKLATIAGALGHAWAAEGLEASKKATLTMAKCYRQFREGEAWAGVRDALSGEGVAPISADRVLLELRTGEAVDMAADVQADQGALAAERSDDEAKAEDAFLGTILLQRDQEIRQAIIKRNALVPKSLKKRKQEKEAKQKMLAASSTLAPVGDEEAAAQ